MKDIKEFENKIICDDCINIMRELPDKSIDLIITDPPYNIGQSNKRTKQGNKIISNKEAWGKWDDYDNLEFDEFMFECIKEWYRILKDGGILYCFTAREKNGYYYDYACNKFGFTYQNTIAIIKDNPLPHFTKTNYRSAFELCFYVSKNKPKTFNFLSQNIMINKFHYLIGKKDTTHPTEKPLNILTTLIKVSSNENDIILDCFAGSGTFLIAALNNNRRYIGIEKEKKYCDIVEKRINKAKENILLLTTIENKSDKQLEFCYD